VADGRTIYHGAPPFTLEGAPKYPTLAIQAVGSAEKLKHAIAIHQQGETDYPTFCVQAAEAGVEKWITHMLDMTVTYLDQQGNRLAVEPIPLPNHRA
ncbi:DUF1398 family protein, partial [Arthrospira platensis SPKY1]|nr:DUF1398 family protein [Arthrospira platensis SPKY1]